ncbi:hypothetical protein Q8A67_014337 [Cirrhinus molitorella]|uniref:Uncharacterized protein n=1 Tax=Cirrhinus molitorella TaxID=172907 RepID=A0AA88PMR3_9TELE|nr:hypothetical protein Q8A67_014337 [Cirrhinus molitorella]
MGCAASVILFEGLRRVLHRNCGYVCKPELEAEEPEEEEDTLSRRESLAITPSVAASLLLRSTSWLKFRPSRESPTVNGCIQ